MACGSGTVPPGQGLCELRMDSRTRLAVAHTHGRFEVRARDAPLPRGSGARTSSGSILTTVGQCPGTRPTTFGHMYVCMDAWARQVAAQPRHSANPTSAQIRTHVCVHGRMGSAGGSATAPLCKPDVRTESMRAHERMIYRTAPGR